MERIQTRKKAVGAEAYNTFLSRTYHGWLSPLALFTAAVVSIIPVILVAQMPFDLSMPALLQHVMSGVPVVLYGWFFGHAFVAWARRRPV